MTHETHGHHCHSTHTTTSSSSSSHSSSSSTSTCTSPGYASPLEAMKSGTREKVLYIPFIPVHSSSGATKPDYLATIDVDSSSSTFGQVVHRVYAQAGDELHHTGWNTCSSCHGDSTKQRRYLIAPSLSSGNIYIFDTQEDRKPRLHKFIDGQIIKEKYHLTWPHTTHCLSSGEMMISYIGNDRQDGTGGFLLLDDDFNPIKRWESETTPYGYDFWYQPKHNIMVSTGWGNPNKIKNGFNPAEIGSDYCSEIFFWDWKQRKIIQKENLGDKGLIPLEVRFLHDPKSTHGYVAAALSSTVIHFWKDDNEEKWKWEVVVAVPWKEVEGWALPKMPALITDFVISLDDKFMYLSNWLHGDVRQYDISNPAKPKLVGQIFLGGSIREGGSVKEKNPNDNDNLKDVKKK